MRAGVGAFAVMSAAVILAAWGCAGCTSTTGGSGSAAGQQGSSSTQPGQSSASSQSSDPGTSAPVPSGGASSIPPPDACPGGTCKQTMSSTLTAPYEVIVRTNPDYANGAGAAVVELARSGVAISWYVVSGETPAEITCSSTPSQSNCVLVDQVGAHGSDAIVFRLSGETLHRGSTVRITTPQAHARDLNGDGWVDVFGVQNDGKPDYANGRVYWQTWVSNGVFLNSTGCTAPASTAPPQPTDLLHGNCP